MKKLIASFLLPWFSLIAGGAGLVLARLLYTDGQNSAHLLTPGYVPGILLLILSGAVALILALLVRKMPKRARYSDVYPKSVSRGIGRCIGAVGIAYTCIQRLSPSDFLSVLVLIFGVAAAICLLLSGTQRFFGIRPHYLLYTVLTVYFMVLGLVQCRQWGSQPQVMYYLFSLMAALFLILYSYYHTVLSFNGENLRLLLYSANAAIFFCCAAFPAEYNYFYLAAALWLALDTRPTKLAKKE